MNAQQQIQAAPGAVQIPRLKTYQLRDEYQVPCYEAIAQAFRNYQGPFIIDVTVGGGKSLLAAAVAHRAQEMGKSVIVLARQGEIVEQDSEEMWLAGVKNSIYSASVGPKSTHYPIIVGSEGTVARALDGDLKDHVFDFCICDEAHQVPVDEEDSQYMKILNELLRRNSNMRILGMTGSPYRGTKDIVGDFWKKCVYKVSTQRLIDLGYLVPTFFGYEVQQTQSYDLGEFHVHGGHDPSDFSQKELLAMQRKITKEITLTEQITKEVIELTKDRNAVMITGAGKKHLEQIAGFLPEDSWVMITDSTGAKARRESLKQVAKGDKKFLLQINCLSTGFNEPLIDTTVIMRKIGSLTLLVQLLGRGMRLLKPHHKEAGIVKNDHLVLDFSDTLAEMADMYNDPVLEKAQLDKAKKEHDLISCPVCNTKNSSHARRCMGREEPGSVRLQVDGRTNYAIDGRCEWFWSKRDCPHCKTPNDTAAKECRSCGELLIDPNANLKGKHYTDDDFREVVHMNMRLSSNGNSIVVDYLIRDVPGEHDKVVEHKGEKLVQATEVLHPGRKEGWARGPWFAFLKAHLHKSWHSRVIGKPAASIVKQAAIFDVPVKITHRSKAKGTSIIHRKQFRTGRTIDK